MDILRGFALFGVLTVDISAFASPAGLPGYVPPPATAWYLELLKSLVQFLVAGKFYTIFSFLFGLGFSLQLARAELRCVDIRSYYYRRLCVLLGIGVVHAVFLWTADILRVYALLGFTLPAFQKRSNRALLIWAGLFCLIGLAVSGLGRSAAVSGDAAIPGIDVVGMARTAYHSPFYVDVLIFQALSFPASFIITLLTRGPNVMALFLFGLLVGRSKFLEHLAEKRVVVRRVVGISLVAGLAGEALVLTTGNPWLHSIGNTICSFSLATAYMSGLALLSLSAAGARALGPLGKLGRMALTNYLLQSIICSLLFDGFAFGLYEQVNQAGLLGITMLVYFSQILFSVWWLSRYQFGPAEWLWRSLTYRRRQPFRETGITQTPI